MKRFLLECGIFAAMAGIIVAIVAVFVFPRVPFDVSNLEECRAHFQQQIDQSGEGPRIFLVGGSNLLYGVDNALLRESLNARYAIVNFGWDAGLGVGPLLEQLAPLLRRGDCVVFAFEYTNGTRWGGGATSITYQCDVLGGNLLSIGRGKYTAYPWFGLKYYVKQKVNKLFRRQTDALDEAAPEANFRAFYDAPTAEYTGLPVIKTDAFEWSDTASDRLTEFFSLCQDRGVVCLISAPTYDARHFRLHEREIEAIYEVWRALIRDMPHVRVVSEPKDYAYPLEMIYNTKWHVNGIGRHDRTLRLAADIQKGLSDVGVVGGG